MKQNAMRLIGVLALVFALLVPMTLIPVGASTADPSSTPTADPSSTPTADPSSAPTVDPSSAPTESHPPATVRLDRTHFDLSVNKTDILIATVTTDSANKEVTWSSNFPNIADVSEGGIVTGISPGEAVITARSKANPDAVAECTVRVLGPDDAMEIKLYQVPGSQISQNHVFTLRGDGTLELRAGIPVGDNEFSSDVMWSADPAGIISWTEQTAPEGSRIIITPVKDQWGIVTLTAASRARPEVKISVKVQVPKSGDVLVTGITLSPATLSIKLGESKALTAVVTPYNATDKTVTWTCVGTDDKGRQVASVDSKGNVFGLAAGKATVTARAGAYSASCEVTVSPVTTGIRVNPTSTLNKVGDTLPIQATLVPENSTDTVTWTSSDTKVVTVENATGTNRKTLHFKGPGEATVTAKSGNYSAECRVVVSGIVLDKSALTMIVGSANTLILDGRYGDAAGSAKAEWKSSDPGGLSVRASGNAATLTAYAKGSYTITVTVEDYTATCAVTVAEDTSVIINGGTVNAGNALQLSRVASQLNSVCSSKTGAALSYINNISVPTEQGIVYNNHRSEADTGAGVGVMEQYKPSGSGPDTLSALSFAARSTYSGTAEITFTGWGTNGQSFNGIIRMTVTGLGKGSDVTYSTNGDPVAFLSEDFNTVSNSKAGHNLKYVTFTSPAASAGTLYYNYTSESYPGEKVLSTTQYRRNGSPSLDRVTFVPAKGYSGTVRISYRGVDSSDVAYTGTVTIHVAAQYDPAAAGDIYYSTGYGSWANFRAVDFYNASLRTTGEALSYVHFQQPPSSQGTLFYDYGGFASNGGVISSGTNYYSSGNPSLGSVSFVPTTTSPGQVDISYTGYSIRGTSFTGTVHVTVVGKPVQSDTSGAWYTTVVGRSLELKGSDFYRACREATGKTLYYVQFTSLPSVGTGTLRYTSRNGASSSAVSTDTWCYYDRPNAGVQLDNVFFQPGSNFTGIVRIPYQGYCTDRTSFNGEMVIRVGGAAGSAYFNDMKNYSWAVSAVDYLRETDVVNGIGGGKFGPAQKVLRRDFVVMLCRAFGFDSNSTYSFPDVPTNAYYSRAIAAAKQLGVVSGSGGNFMPDGQLTRQDAMVMIKNALDAAGWRVGTASTSVLNRFPDGGSVAVYAQDAVSTLVQLGAVSGDGNGRLNPRNTITRAEVAVILHYIMTM